MGKYKYIGLIRINIFFIILWVIGVFFFVVCLYLFYKDIFIFLLEELFLVIIFILS